MLTPLGKKRKIHIVLPAFNEGQKIGKIITDIFQVMDEFGFPSRIIIVDDGSTDNTREIVTAAAHHHDIIYRSHTQNQGLGASIRDGLSYAADNADDQDIIITMDADDTHPPGSILQMVRMIYEGYDVVIASRYVSGARIVGVPWYRQILSFGASLLVQIVFPITGVKDYTCGYRAYRAAVMKHAFERYGDQFVSEDGFQCMIDILLKLRAEKVVMGEIPFILRYDNKVGRSKMRIGKTILNTLMLLLKKRLHLTV